jgi:predicted nucleic acid-binding protein
VRVFLDANVLFSAARDPEGRAAALLRVAGKARAEMLTSAHALLEARRNLALKNPDRASRLDQLMAGIIVVAEAPPVLVEWARARPLPAGDAPILAAASHAGADLLVTGDRTHFGGFFGKRLGGVEVVPPVAALARLLGLAGKVARSSRPAPA